MEERLPVALGFLGRYARASQISRALVDIFSTKALEGKLAFRGGTALHKLHLAPAARYSEDIDLVQVAAEPIGETIGVLREVLKWIGKKKPAYESTGSAAKLTFSTTAEAPPHKVLKVKIEINRTYALKDAQQVHRDLEARKTTGSVVMLP